MAAWHDSRGANKGRDDPAVSHEGDRARKKARKCKRDVTGRFLI